MLTFVVLRWQPLSLIPPSWEGESDLGSGAHRSSVSKVMSFFNSENADLHL